MKNKERLFTPLGIDHLTIACNDNALWSRVLERFGFIRIGTEQRKFNPFDVNEYDAYFGIAMALGDVRLFLVDRSTKRFGKGYLKTFLIGHGNMQVVEAGIRVDSLRNAHEELTQRGLSLIPQFFCGDAFGGCITAQLSFPSFTSFQWKLVERINESPMGIDHLAIAVKDVDGWARFYQFSGFDIVYTPHGQEEGLIEGKESAMRTFALRRGGWTVALVEGIDRERTSQVTTYTETHGDHSAHHAALLFKDLERAVESLLGKGVQFRLNRIPSSFSEPLTVNHILHRGEDYGGPLLQCFTKPLERRNGKSGFFFELIERVSLETRREDKQAFHDPTVIGLFESIEREDKLGDIGCMFLP